MKLIIRSDQKQIIRKGKFMWKKEIEVAKTAAVEAGKAIMEVYSLTEGIEISYKEGGSPLTEADRRANAIIVTALRDHFPGYAILSEEEKDSPGRLDNDLCFIVDPLDGTKEFIKKNGQFTVNIALAYRHRVVAGVIFVPVTKELYFAEKDQGAYLLEEGGEAVKLKVSGRTGEGRIRMVMSSSHGCKELDDLLGRYEFESFVKVGSSLKGCMIAKGEAEVYYRYNPTMEWDTAAMQCIVEEAGGIFRQMDDTEMLYNRENSLNDKGFYAVNDMRNRV